jgi:hypothetical protein
MELVQNRFTSCSRRLLTPPVIGTTMIALVISSYVSLKLHSEIPMPAVLAFPSAALACCLVATATLDNAYRVKNLSASCLRRIRTCRMSPWSKHVLKSMKPLLVEIGPYFSVQQSTSFTFLDLAVDNTITLLLAF